MCQSSYISIIYVIYEYFTRMFFNGYPVRQEGKKEASVGPRSKLSTTSGHSALGLVVRVLMSPSICIIFNKQRYYTPQCHLETTPAP